MNRVNSLRDLLPGNQGGPDSIVKMQEYLRANVHQDDDAERSRAISVLPGDDGFEDHPAYLPPNRYTKFGFRKLKTAWDRGLVPPEHKDEVFRAMKILADGQSFGSIPCIAVDQTEVIWYSGRECDSDDDVYDPSATRGPSNFVSTVQHSGDDY